MSHDVQIIKENGLKLKGLLNHGEQLYFYEDNKTRENYPVYFSGKAKGDIAFTKTGTLVLTEAIFNRIKQADGYLRDGQKNVTVELPTGLSIMYKTPKIYAGMLLEMLKADLDKRSSNHLHSMEAVEESYNKYVLPYRETMEKTKLKIEVEKRGDFYSYLYIEGHYIDNSYTIDKLLDFLGVNSTGNHTIDFKTKLSNVMESHKSYESLEALCQ